MSKQSEKARAERRAAVTVNGQRSELVVSDVDREAGMLTMIPGTETEAIIDENGTHVLANIHAVALVPEDGGFRLVQLSLTPSMAEACATSATEPEVLAIQLAKAQAMLEELARGVAADGTQRARVCSTCGAAALVRHPDPAKRVDLCTSCNARHAVSA